MKKTFRTLSAIALSAALLSSVAAMPMTAFAADNASITINTAAGDKQTHDYKAYPIIVGELATDNQTLTELAWGSGVNADTFITKLKAFDGAKTSPNTQIQELTATSSANDVAKALTGYSDVEGLAKVFNETGVLKGDGIALTKSGSGDSATYSKGSLANGWYLIKDFIELSAPNVDKVRSANLLQVRGDTDFTPNPKYSLPTLEKKILDGSPVAPVDANEASIGDTVKYQIKVPVPNMTGYNKYYYIVDDTLSKGLTYADSLTITCDGLPSGSQTLTLDTDGADTGATGDYYVTTSPYSATTGTDIKIVFENFLTKFGGVTAGTDIVITYSATLNENADISDAGNPNEAKLSYSNDPNHTYGGKTGDDKPDEPDTDETNVVGITPKDEVKTYTTALKIKKVDESDAPLTGAEFKITGDNMNKVIVLRDTFTEDATEGTYWKLKDNTYTTTDPATLVGDETALAAYASTTKKYKRTTATEIRGAGESNVTVEGAVDSNGWLVFKGLGAGTYTITETKTPDDTYNSIAPFNVTISNDKGEAAGPTLTNPNWKVVKGSSEITAVEDNAFTFKVVNSQGIVLPGTGGIGTTIFYVVGVLFIAGGAVLLISKKRMNIKEK